MLESSSPCMSQALFSIVTWLVLGPASMSWEYLPLAFLCTLSFGLSVLFSELDVWTTKYNSKVLYMIMLPMVEPLIELLISIGWGFLAIFHLMQTDPTKFVQTKPLVWYTLNYIAWFVPVAFSVYQYTTPSAAEARDSSK